MERRREAPSKATMQNADFLASRQRRRRFLILISKNLEDEKKTPVVYRLTFLEANRRKQKEKELKKYADTRKRNLLLMSLEKKKNRKIYYYINLYEYITRSLTSYEDEEKRLTILTKTNCSHFRYFMGVISTCI